MAQLAMTRMASSSLTFKAHFQTTTSAFRGQLSWLHGLPLTAIFGRAL